MFSQIKALLSYITPFVKNKQSLFNGNLKIMFVNGRKILNTRDANYSYGSLHRIMRFAIAQTKFSGTEDILLLGLGAGSVIALLRDDFKIVNTIRAVDIDPIVIQVAREEFGLDSYKDTQIICQDAYDFVRESPEKHGLIIIDLFIKNIVPEKFFDDIFWENISRILTVKGQIIFNTMIKTTKTELFQGIIMRLEGAGFQVCIHDKVDHTNVMILAKKC